MLFYHTLTNMTCTPDHAHADIHPMECVKWVVLLGGRSVVCLAGHHSSCLSSIDQIGMKMFVVSAGWCPQLTNELCEVSFVHKCSCFFSNKTKSNLYGPYTLDINTYVYI